MRVGEQRAEWEEEIVWMTGMDQEGGQMVGTEVKDEQGKAEEMREEEVKPEGMEKDTQAEVSGPGE